MKKIKAFKRYLREHPNKIWVGLILILLISYIGISAYFIYSVLLFKGIETLLRYSMVIISGITIIIFSLTSMNVLLKEKFLRFLLYLILISSIGIGQYYLGSNLSKFYSSLNTINKEEITYSSCLITLKSSNITKITDIKNKKIGILEDTNSIEGYQLPNEILNENKLNNNNDIIKYDDFIFMLNDLYDEKVDAIFLSSNYESMYTSIERFKKISTEVIEITTKSRTVEKTEVISGRKSKKLTEPFTILLLGLDSKYEGIEKSTSFNGDSIILITFNPNTLNSTILSIPRDTYVPIMCWSGHPDNKITHAAWQGESCVIKTVENLTGIDIDYYVKINFKGVVGLVNALDGVKVNVPYSFCEQNSSRKWGKNTIYVEKGEQVLNGEQALALSRNRKTNSSCGAKWNTGERNDFIRGQNQQLVIKAVIDKLKSIKNVEAMLNILDVMSFNMDTNLTTNQILSFYNVGKDILAKARDKNDEIITMDHLYISGYGRRIYDLRSKWTLYNYIYYKGSLNDIVNAMKVNLGLKKPTIIKDFSFSINDPYKKVVIGKKSYSEAQIQTVPKFTSNTKAYALNWGINNNVPIKFEIVESSDPTYKQDQITNQSIPYGYLMSALNKTEGITLTIINKSTTPAIINCSLEENYTNPSCLVPNMVGKTINELNDWISELPISIIVNKTEVKEMDAGYDPLNAGLVTSQSISSGTKLIDITSIDFTYMALPSEEIKEETTE
ncbi:MAG: LCP family protein [Bacilli bacterium]